LESSSHLERAKISYGIEVVLREIHNNAYAKLIIVIIIIIIIIIMIYNDLFSIYSLTFIK